MVGVRSSVRIILFTWSSTLKTKLQRVILSGANDLHRALEKYSTLVLSKRLHQQPGGTGPTVTLAKLSNNRTGV